MNQWTRIGFVALCGVLGAGCLSETRYVCPPGSDVTASTRCGAACASGELSDAECVLVAEACADGRLSAIDCEGLGGDQGVPDMATLDQGDAGDDGDVVDRGVDLGPCGGPCTTPTPLCNSVSGMCVQCLSMSDCGGSTPECDTTTGQCVECLNAGDCGGVTPVCLSGECVQCEDSTDCDAGNPVCESPAQVCGNCTARAQCFGYAALPSCNVTTGQCAQCDGANESADCGDTPETPRCSATQQCVECRPGTSNLDCTEATASRCVGEACAACTMDSHCAHISGKPRCFGGVCRECSPATENADCGAESCNPATRTCSGITRFSRNVCEACVSDSDCVQAGGTFRCIPMNYMGTPRGGYCMRTSPGCMRPFGFIINASSLSGAASTSYCGIDQSVVTCEAVNALRNGDDCPSGSATECAADGALCETVGAFSNLCTYSCGNINDCLPSGNGSTCAAGYCGS